MMEEMTNKTIYSTSETKWGNNYNSDLLSFERRLIDKYLLPLGTEGKLLEEGCGGGRISERLSEMGFAHIDAFDFTKQFIEGAQKRGSSVRYFVADASDLSGLGDAQYDALIAFGQLMCFVPAEKIDVALREACRVCKPGAIALFSFLNYSGRWFNRPLSGLLGVLRCLRGEKRLSSRQLPWLHLRGKPNWRILQRGQATNYWFTETEMRNRLSQAGFEVLELFTNKEPPRQGTMFYVACKKRNENGQSR